MHKRSFVADAITRTWYRAEVLLIAALLLLFSWCIHADLPLQGLSFAALGAIAWMASNHPVLLRETIGGLFTDFTKRQLVVFHLLGLASGILAAFYFRYSASLSLFPRSVQWFVLVAISVAVVEELFFRGLLQSLVQEVSHRLAAPLPALIHAGYKAMIFVPMVNRHETQLLSLFCWSFLAFLGLGYLKQVSKSLVPPVVAHLVFDVLVYAGYTQAPWWVW